MVLLLFSIMFVTTVLIGLSYQIYQMSDLYFSYKIGTSVKIGIPKILKPQAVSLCVRYTDILEYSRLNAETGRNWSYTRDLETIFTYKDNLTLAEIFKYTPAVDKVVDMIAFRNSDSYDFTFRFGSDSHDVEVHKYFYLAFICYRIVQTNAIPQAYTFYTVTPSVPGLISLIELSAAMNLSTIVQVSVHGSQTFPYRSLKTVPFQVRLREGQNEETGSTVYNSFAVYNVRETTRLLPPPFESDCFDYTTTDPPTSNEEQCFQICVKKIVVKETNHLPFSALMLEPDPLPVISDLELKDRNLSSRLLEIDRYCREEVCPRTACSMDLSITKTVLTVDKHFTIRLNSPPEPWFTIRAHAKMSLVEFLTYTLSAMGMWTGLNMMSIEPHFVLKKVKKHLLCHKRSGKVKHKQPDQVRVLNIVADTVYHMSKRLHRLESAGMTMNRTYRKPHEPITFGHLNSYAKRC